MLYIPSGRSYYDIHFLENLHVVIHIPSSETLTISFRIYIHNFYYGLYWSNCCNGY